MKHLLLSTLLLITMLSFSQDCEGVTNIQTTEFIDNNDGTITITLNWDVVPGDVYYIDYYIDGVQNSSSLVDFGEIALTIPVSGSIYEFNVITECGEDDVTGNGITYENPSPGSPPSCESPLLSGISNNLDLDQLAILFFNDPTLSYNIQICDEIGTVIFDETINSNNPSVAFPEGCFFDVKVKIICPDGSNSWTMNLRGPVVDDFKDGFIECCEDFWPKSLRGCNFYICRTASHGTPLPTASSYFNSYYSRFQALHQPIILDTIICDVTDGYLELFKTILVYPNPVKDNVTINISAASSMFGSFQLLDINGKVIEHYLGFQNVDLSHFHSTIDLSGLLKGQYFIKIESVEGFLTYPIYKE